MDSEDDMHDANDLDSLDDDFYSGETEDAPMDYYTDYDDDADDYFDDGDDSDPADSRRPEVCLFLWFFYSIRSSARKVAYQVSVLFLNFNNELD